MEHFTNEDIYQIGDFEKSLCYKVDKDTLGQYTGLHDKNGKEIYEGDIVRKFNGIIGKVIYEHSEFIIDVTNNKKLVYGRLDLIENFVEVIGNIYDNPDLLEKGAEE